MQNKGQVIEIRDNHDFSQNQLADLWLDGLMGPRYSVIIQGPKVWDNGPHLRKVMHLEGVEGIELHKQVNFVGAWD